MKKRTGKMISLSLAVAMAMTAAPVTALAVNEPTTSVENTVSVDNAGEQGTEVGTTTETGKEAGEGGDTTTEKDVLTSNDGEALTATNDLDTTSNEPVEVRVESEEALHEAIKNANDGDKILVTKGFTLTKPVIIDKGITVEVESLSPFSVDPNGDFNEMGDNHVFRLSHKNAVLDNVTLYLQDNHQQLNIVYVSAGTVKDCWLVGSGATDSPVTRGIMVESGAKNVTITGNHFEDFFASAYINSGAEGEIADNNSVNTKESWCIANGSNMDLTGNTFEGTTTIDIKIFADSPSQTNNYTKEKFLAISKNNSSAHIQNEIDGVTALDGSIIVSDKDSLEKAIAYADATETPIALQADITGDFVIGTNKNVSLDLNGFKITNKSGHTITNNGTLTIKDSSGGKTGTIDNVTHTKAAIWNNGTTTLESGRFIRSEEAGVDSGNHGGNSYYTLLNHGTMIVKDGVYVENKGKYSSMFENGWQNGNDNTSGTNSILLIEGGTFSGGLNTIKNDDYGELTINGGTFTNMAQAAFLNWNVATVNDGTFEANEGSNAIILNGYGNATMDKGELTINGGSFNTEKTSVNFIETMYKQSGYTSGTIEVNGGNIYGDILLSDVTKGATLSISNGVTINGNITNGGVANVDVTNATVTGKVSNTGTGSMAVTESKVGNYDENKTIIFIDSSKIDGTPIPDSNIGDAVAMIGTTTYDTFDEAIADAESGQTIRLMKNVEVDHAVTIPAGVTLDGGKNTTITLTTKLDNGAFITAGGDNVTIQNITIDTNEKAKHGVQFYCVKGGEMDKVTVNGGYYTSVIVNGAEATIKNSILNLDEGKGYANIEFAVGDKVTTVPKVTVENVTTTPNKPVVYMDNVTLDRIKDISGYENTTRDELNKQYVNGAFLYYYDSTASDPDDTLPVITFDPTEGSIADSAETQKINTSGHLASLPTASRSGYRLDGWYTKAEGGDKITTDTLFTENTTVYAQWSKKSSSSSRYDGYITIINPKNGEVSVSDDWAYEDDKITLTITPDDGYEVDKIEIVDDEGDKIDAKKVDDEDNKYTFRMANCDVTVTVTFKEEGKTTEDTDKEEDKDDEETTELNFTDVKESDWFYKGVAYVVDKGVMSGVSENQFDPSGKLTRAMLVQMLYNMESRPACDSENAFIDVPVGQWYTDAVIWANDEKIVSGMGDGLFAPNMEITREQMVVMLYNYAKYKGYDVTASADLSKFADNASVSTWAQPAMQWAVAEGYISGMGDSQLAPQGTATRAEIASVIMRFMEATAETAETAE